jgi:hypothetical protein
MLIAARACVAEKTTIRLKLIIAKKLREVIITLLYPRPAYITLELKVRLRTTGYHDLRKKQANLIVSLMAGLRDFSLPMGHESAYIVSLATDAESKGKELKDAR